MKRTYRSGESEDVKYFLGLEIELTPAYGLKTLFVKGIQPHDEILQLYKKYNCTHIFFGANHSYKPHVENNWSEWETLIQFFLEQDFLCTLDIPIESAEQFTKSCLCDYDNFIPQIRVPIPHIKTWNYNTMVKIDDKDFRYSNPGVWCHSLHDLMDHEKFTDWLKYRNDQIID